MILLVLISVTLFPMYANLSYANVPIYAYTCSKDNQGAFKSFIKADLAVTPQSVCKASDPLYVLLELHFPLYVISMLTFLGWMMACFFLPTGMWGFFFDSVQAFAYRPTKTDKMNFD
jgi:hypothetical protein